MSRVFAYCRVSTTEQVTENQVLEIKGAGFALESHRIVEERISGSVAAYERPKFKKLSEKLETSDVLIVTKLDRLGRNAMDVRATVEKLAHSGVRVHCLALGGVDLSSSAGKMTMQVISAIAEFERDLLIERTHSGLTRAKAAGKKFGRPSALSEDARKEVVTKLYNGCNISELARDYNTSRQTILRIRDSEITAKVS